MTMRTRLRQKNRRLNNNSYEPILLYRMAYNLTIIRKFFVSWYDNENSYTSQMVRTIKYFAEL